MISLPTPPVIPPSESRTSSSEPGWRQARKSPSLSDVYASIRVPAQNASFWRKLMAFWGPGLMVAVGYMDPGNWATDIAGGARYGYTLLSVILISNLFAMLLQHLAAKLGIVTGRDLAQACRDHYSKPVAMMLWVLCEIAIAACDLAEVIGSAIALNLLFGLPLTVGVVLTILDVLVVLFFQSKGFRIIESIVAGLIVVIFGCFLYEVIVSRPDWVALAGGLLPKTEIVTNPAMLYVAIGILGATVMPHNLYLHSSIVQTRAFEQNPSGKRMAIKFATIDSTVALFLAFFVNAAILVLAAATFHRNGLFQVADIHDAHKLLAPVLGAGAAGAVFAVALLASGQNSTLTGTLAGQIVMEGFLDLKLKPWLRRLITRLIAVVPAFIVTLLYGEKGTGELLVLSQVILSLQLSFAVVPLVLFTSDRRKMGQFVNASWVKVTAWVVSGIIISLNAYLLFETFFG
ncbi:divalent metal cation transporter [Hymenobacter busanensis]|uniref:Divalent metal cation transporter MntH n=1 Tax=Hymenobacter busanensis TaxID=2607656 RepID=A0A7L4ZZ35_9BACT|nr:Nramp family divalent metal transporter [Hymenobacter busanensis]KAA9331628.1 divalent metal cation transporter [Hymenobacter busanensis]QHJ08779.1 Mn(2+) uptake NRAMP transporter MntH [Hymenobacter busanensis]